jgi:hypothetical protein
MKTVVFVAVLLVSASVRAQSDSSLKSLLRLKPGNYWVYSGVAESTGLSKPGEPLTVKKFPVRWKIEILEETSRDDLRAYLVRGGFLDLAWFEPKRKRQDYLWIAYDGRFYSLQLTADLLKAFRDPKADLLSHIESEQPLIQLPLTNLSCAEPLVENSQEVKRDDFFYCWFFQEKKKRRVNAIGLGTRSMEVWELWYRSNPDHQILGFAPHIGFVSYDFAHHGTPSEAHVKLVAVHLK